MNSEQAEVAVKKNISLYVKYKSLARLAECDDRANKYNSKAREELYTIKNIYSRFPNTGKIISKNKDLKKLLLGG